MNQTSIGSQISNTRKDQGFTQEELALKCNVNIRTIQRIESGEVIPRMYTLRLINEVLGTDYFFDNNHSTNKEIHIFREKFRQRKRIRIAIAIAGLTLMIAVALIGYPSWEIFGLQKREWAPFLYLIMFGLIAGIAIFWRCPACNGILGDAFNTKFCSKCGMKFYD